MKNWIRLLLPFMAAWTLSACNNADTSSDAQQPASSGAATSAPVAEGELPTINVGYIFTTNHTPLQVAMAKGDDFKQNGLSLHPVIPKEKYQLMEGDKPIANLNVIVNKSGSETSTLFAQNRLDVAAASITAVMAGIDKGTSMKIVSPLVLVSGGLVVDKDSPINDWAAFVAAAKQSKQPLKVGYHSPTSAPKIILEGALHSEGLKVSQDPNDNSAQVLLVDLKETSNMLPALVSKQVDAVVGPEPFPQTAVFKKTGKVLSELRDMPPAGQWKGFPCCVIVASDDMIAKHPELLRKFLQLMAGSIAWSNEHREEAGAVAADWIGMPPEVGKASRLQFIGSFTDSWKQGAAGYIDVLNQAGYFKGQLKDKNFEQAQPLLIDSSFIAQ